MLRDFQEDLALLALDVGLLALYVADLSHDAIVLGYDAVMVKEPLFVLRDAVIGGWGGHVSARP